MDPIFFFDELDKVSETRAGQEIIGKLIHLTDHTQNNNFMDRYFHGIPIDISRAVFIFSFNDINLVNHILLDRIKVIKMDQFTRDDRINIAREFLLPKILEDNKLSNVKFTDECFVQIINKFSNNCGVRDIKRCLEEIAVKINVLKFIPDPKIKISFDSEKIIITPNIIDKMIKGLPDNESFHQMYV
jgi:ATP-dependent Lon protease